MQAQLLLGVPSDKFIDINTIEHVFPEEIKNIGFPVTLLHNHPHAPVNSLLIYKNNFSVSEYQEKKTLKITIRVHGICKGKLCLFINCVTKI
jgi:uncharacterized protein YlxW (UPF0749 family)